MIKEFAFVLAIIFFPAFSDKQIFLPLNLPNRHSIENLKLTGIGNFGLLRKERKNIPQHLHTGIDIKRPRDNYSDEPIFPLAKGRVLSKRIDGPYAQLIIEHDFNGTNFWTAYEHIAGISVKPGDQVDPFMQIARFMNREELNKYGWQFDHFHFEIIKIKPQAILNNPPHPERFYKSFTLECFSEKDLDKYFFDPLEFFKDYLHN